MTRLETSVVIGERLGVPVAPAPASRTDLVDAGGLLGAGQQPVGPIERVLRDTLARQSEPDVVLQERAASDTAPLRAASAARKHRASRRGAENDGEMPAVRARH